MDQFTIAHVVSFLRSDLLGVFNLARIKCDWSAVARSVLHDLTPRDKMVYVVAKNNCKSTSLTTDENFIVCCENAVSGRCLLGFNIRKIDEEIIRKFNSVLVLHSQLHQQFIGHMMHWNVSPRAGDTIATCNVQCPMCRNTCRMVPYHLARAHQEMHQNVPDGFYVESDSTTDIYRCYKCNLFEFAHMQNRNDCLQHAFIHHPDDCYTDSKPGDLTICNICNSVIDPSDMDEHMAFHQRFLFRNNIAIIHGKCKKCMRPITLDNFLHHEQEHGHAPLDMVLAQWSNQVEQLSSNGDLIYDCTRCLCLVAARFYDDHLQMHSPLFHDYTIPCNDELVRVWTPNMPLMCNICSDNHRIPVRPIGQTYVRPLIRPEFIAEHSRCHNDCPHGYCMPLVEDWTHFEGYICRRCHHPYRGPDHIHQHAPRNYIKREHCCADCRQYVANKQEFENHECTWSDFS
jgi:hypothetical protein